MSPKVSHSVSVQDDSNDDEDQQHTAIMTISSMLPYMVGLMCLKHCWN